MARGMIKTPASKKRPPRPVVSVDLGADVLKQLDSLIAVRQQASFRVVTRSVVIRELVEKEYTQQASGERREPLTIAEERLIAGLINAAEQLVPAAENVEVPAYVAGLISQLENRVRALRQGFVEWSRLPALAPEPAPNIAALNDPVPAVTDWNGLGLETPEEMANATAPPATKPKRKR